MLDRLAKALGVRLVDLIDEGTPPAPAPHPISGAPAGGIAVAPVPAREPLRIIGRVAAGPATAGEQIDLGEARYLDAAKLPKSAFGLQVAGNSMYPILPEGTLIAVKPFAPPVGLNKQGKFIGSPPRDGALVVAELAGEHEYTVKFFERDGHGGYLLRPANLDFKVAALTPSWSLKARVLAIELPIP